MDNTTLTNSNIVVDKCDYSWFPQWVTILITLAYVLVIVSAVIENICVVIVIVLNKTMHSTTTFYLFSLAISDLCLVMCRPVLMITELWFRTYPSWFRWTIVIGWRLGLGTSALTVAVFTIERYLVICQPLNILQLAVQKTRVIIIIALIWIFTLLVRLVPLLLQNASESANIISMVSYAIFYIIPFVVIATLSCLMIRTIKKSKRHTRENIFKDRTFYILAIYRFCQRRGATLINPLHLGAIILTFFVCWILPIPFYILVNNMEIFSKKNTTECSLRLLYGFIKCLPAIINPIVYSALSLNFRQAFQVTFMGHSPSQQNGTGEVSLDSMYGETPINQENIANTAEDTKT